MSQIHKINVTLSESQKMLINQAFFKRGPITLRLKKDALSGSDTLLVPSKIFERLEKNRAMNKGMEIKFREINFTVPDVGTDFDSLISISETHGPSVTKPLIKTLGF